MIKNAIFDLDGTLLDTGEGVIESAMYAAKQMGYRELPYETMVSFVGPTIQNSFMNHYGCSKEDAQRAADIFRDYYKKNALFKAKPYEGIYELIEVLKENDFKIAVATYKREDYALTLLRYFNFDKYCDSMHGADNRNILKKADIIHICQDELRATKEDCVLIGDTNNDAIGASEANIPFIAVTYGFGFKSKSDVNEFPHIGVAKKPMEIADIVMDKEK